MANSTTALPVQARILRLLARKKRLHRYQIQKALGVSNSTLDHALHAMGCKGILTRCGKGKATTWGLPGTEGGMEPVVFAPGPAQVATLEVIKRRGPIRLAAISRAVNKGVRTVESQLKALVHLGMISTIERGLYVATRAGQAYVAPQAPEVLPDSSWLPSQEIRALSMLSEQGCTVMDLAREMTMEPTAVMAMITQMQRQGHLQVLDYRIEGLPVYAADPEEVEMRLTLRVSATSNRGPSAPLAWVAEPVLDWIKPQEVAA